jgi:putative spermidine/putrescine transport system ATP-binding protein
VNAAAIGSKAGSVNARGASLRIAALSKRYEGARTIAVDNLSLDVAAGEFVSLLGASGSGKTTTLMAVAGFTPPDSGSIWIDDHPIVHLPPEKRGIGVVFQNYALFPHMSALRNVMFPLRMRGVASGEAKRRAERSLERVGLGPLGHRLPSELSGGQQQRVALARAIVFEPGLLLMDEPLGALDRALREKMKAEIRRLHRELGITILYVTHDQEEALALSDRIALMQQGRIVQIGTPAELYERPNSTFVASFIGESTLIDGMVVATADGELALDPGHGSPRLPGSGQVRPGQRAVLLLRPEKLAILPGSSAAGVSATITDVVYVGDISRLELELPGGLRIAAKQPNRQGVFCPAVGQAVRVQWARQDAVLLGQLTSSPIACQKEPYHAQTL